MRCQLCKDLSLALLRTCSTLDLANQQQLDNMIASHSLALLPDGGSYAGSLVCRHFLIIAPKPQLFGLHIQEACAHRDRI